MAELADAADSKSADLRVLGVRLPLPAPATEAALDGSPKVFGSGEIDPQVHHEIGLVTAL
jgi:hypothetical protein